MMAGVVCHLGLLSLLVTLAACDKCTMVLDFNTTAIFNQSNQLPVPLNELDVKDEERCVTKCCHTDGCNVAYFNSWSKGDKHACTLYACHPTTACGFVSQKGIEIFVNGKDLVAMGTEWNPDKSDTGYGTEPESDTDVTTSPAMATAESLPPSTATKENETNTTELPVSVSIPSIEDRTITGSVDNNEYMESNTTPNVSSVVASPTQRPLTNTSVSISSNDTSNSNSAHFETDLNATTTPGVPPSQSTSDNETDLGTNSVSTTNITASTAPPPSSSSSSSSTTTTTTAAGAGAATETTTTTTTTTGISPSPSSGNTTASGVNSTTIEPSSSIIAITASSTSPQNVSGGLESTTRQEPETTHHNDLDLETSTASAIIENVTVSSSVPETKYVSDSSSNTTTTTTTTPAPPSTSTLPISSTEELHESSSQTLEGQGNAIEGSLSTSSERGNDSLTTSSITTENGLSTSATPKSTGKATEGGVTLDTTTDRTTNQLTSASGVVEWAASSNGTDTTGQERAMSSVLKTLLLCSLAFGSIFILTVVGVLGKLVFDSYRKRHYSRLDYLINGMY